jgi:PEGA domain-containing protein
MRVACSLILSASLLFPSAVLPLTRTTQDKNAKQAAQEPQPVAPVVKQPLAFGLEDATPIKLRINRNMSSADAQLNETVDFDVLEEVKVHDAIVIPRGGTAWGTVTEAQPKRRMGRAGKLNINIDNVRLTSGEKVALRAVKEVKGGGHQGAITGAIVATSIVFFPAAPLFLLVHGKDITIPKGTEITAYINGDIPLDQKKFATQTGVSPEAGATTVQPTTDTTANKNENGLDATLSTVDIKSAPEGAEITVDEKFMGSTPSSLRLAVGDHKIRLGKSGFKTWERTMTVGAGAAATVDATLEKQE